MRNNKPLAQVTINRNKGYGEERKTAKELSIWMFNDSEVLKRNPREGMDKKTWRGDIIPWKPIPWEYFPFYIEVKNGYEKNIPGFWGYSILEEWISKAIRLGVPKNQDILLLCTKFYNKEKLLFTNHMLNTDYIISKLILPICDDEGCGHYIFCYPYKDVLSLNFYSLFQPQQEEACEQ